MISLGQISTKTSLDQYEQAQTYPSPTHLSDINPLQRNPPSGRESTRNQLGYGETIVNQYDADRIQTRHPSDTQVSQRYLDNSHTPLNILHTNQSTMYQGAGGQSSTRYSDNNRTPIRQSDRAGNVESTIRYGYNAGQTERYRPEYDNLVGYGGSRGNIRGSDSYYRTPNINTFTPTYYDSNFDTDNRRFPTSSNIPTTFYSGGRRYIAPPTYKYPNQ
jgi:hypothetical protein